MGHVGHSATRAATWEAPSTFRDFGGAGGNEVVEVVERPDPTVGHEDVLIAVTVAGMNPADLEQREGRYPAPAGVVPDIPGLEVAGPVLAVGERVASWSPGDRVFGLVGGGGLASRVVVHERCVTRVPEGLGPDQVAAGARSGSRTGAVNSAASATSFEKYGPIRASASSSDAASPAVSARRCWMP